MNNIKSTLLKICGVLLLLCFIPTIFKIVIVYLSIGIIVMILDALQTGIFDLSLIVTYPVYIYKHIK